MLSRVKLPTAAAALGAILAIAAGSFVVAKGPAGATVRFTFNGEATAQVASGNQFAVSGTGYKAGLPVDVCFDNIDCRLADVGTSGEFYQVRTISMPGTYTVTVKQARNRQLERWDLKATTTLNVTP